MMIKRIMMNLPARLFGDFANSERPLGHRWTPEDWHLGRNYYEKSLWEIIMRNYYEKLWWENIMGNYFEKLLWEIVMRNYHDKLLWENIMKDHYEKWWESNYWSSYLALASVFSPLVGGGESVNSWNKNFFVSMFFLYKYFFSERV